MTPIRRCRSLAELVSALEEQGVQLRGGLSVEAAPLLARVQALGAITMVEELHPQRQSLHWHEPTARPSLLLLQHGCCIVEADGSLMRLQAGAHNALWLGTQQHVLTITQAPCRLVRLRLPEGARLETAHAAAISDHSRGWSVDLGLLLPMGRLLEQAQRNPADAHTCNELASTLLAYLWDRLSHAGCRVELPAKPAGSVDPLDQLEVWLRAHLAEPLELADLAAAASLSARRLQQLMRERHGCSPMEWLRQQRLELLKTQLADPRHAAQSLAALMAALQLSDSAATRSSFVRRYGCTPAAYRRNAKAPQPA